MAICAVCRTRSDRPFGRSNGRTGNTTLGFSDSSLLAGKISISRRFRESFARDRARTFVRPPYPHVLNTANAATSNFRSKVFTMCPRFFFFFFSPKRLSLSFFLTEGALSFEERKRERKKERKRRKRNKSRTLKPGDYILYLMSFPIFRVARRETRFPDLRGSISGDFYSRPRPRENRRINGVNLRPRALAKAETHCEPGGGIKGRRADEGGSFFFFFFTSSTGGISQFSCYELCCLLLSRGRARNGGSSRPRGGRRNAPQRRPLSLSLLFQLNGLFDDGARLIYL